MLLLLLIYRISIKKVKETLIIMVLIILGIFLIESLDNFAYKSNDWVYYEQYNEARTIVYETNGVLDFDENEDLFLEQGINKELHILYTEYCLAFNSNVKNDAIMILANEELKIDYEKGNLVNIFTESIKKLFSSEYMIQTLLMLLFIIIVLINSLKQKKYKDIRFLVFLTFTFLIPWAYMAMVNKFVFRVGISAFYCYFFSLIGFIYCKKINLNKIFISILFIICILASSFQIVKTKDYTEYFYYSGIKREFIERWCSNNPDNLYFMTTGLYTEQGMLIDYGKSEVSNVAVLGGGWLANSPLYNEKLETFNILDLEKDIIEKDNIYIIERQEDHIDSLINYYSSVYPDFSYEIVDTIEYNSNSKYSVYKFNNFKDE